MKTFHKVTAFIPVSNEKGVKIARKKKISHIGLHMLMIAWFIKVTTMLKHLSLLTNQAHLSILKGAFGCFNIIDWPKHALQC